MHTTGALEKADSPEARNMALSEGYTHFSTNLRDLRSTFLGAPNTFALEAPVGTSTRQRGPTVTNVKARLKTAALTASDNTTQNNPQQYHKHNPRITTQN